jgi:hypothetical protein
VSGLVENFGARHGIVFDADYAVIVPRARGLVECGYGNSAMDDSPDAYQRDEMIEVLADWGSRAVQMKSLSGCPEIQIRTLPKNSEKIGLRLIAH